MKMRFRGIGVYGTRPGEIEQPGDFGYRIDQPSPMYPQGRFQISIYCPKYGACLHNISRRAPAEHPVWHWDGNVEQPTLTPSISCDAPMRCGRHWTITNGEITP